MKFVEKRKVWFSISSIIIAIGILTAIFSGFKLDIEFAGGTAMVVEMEKTFDKQKVADVVTKVVPNVKPDIIAVGEEKTQASIKISTPLDTTKSAELFQAIKKEFNLKAENYLSNDKIAPTISNELKNKALQALLVATILMLIYIWVRFKDFRFGLAAIIALVHDVLIMLTVYALFKIPLNDAFIAAILTVIGYSINDTIVIFDRIRENRNNAKRQTLTELVDNSTNETLVRSINTSLTTILAIAVLYFVGVESIKNFAFPLMIGIATGTYSSIFIASPLWVLLKEMEKKKRKKLA